MKLNILPSKAKFLAYYYVKIGWTCKSNIITQVTNLSFQDIQAIKQNWQVLYMEYMDNEKNNNDNTDVDIKISQIEDFYYFILDDDNECYEAIYFEIESFF